MEKENKMSTQLTVGVEAIPVKGEILAAAVASQPLDIHNTAVALEIMEKETKLTIGEGSIHIEE